MTKVEIKPTSLELTQLDIVSVSVNLNTSASVVAQVSNLDGYGYSQILLMEGTDYADWGDDDEYLVQWTLNQLGLQRL